ncbi:hypothetical protein ACJIZ3_014592 [Penstemon smallii]|uniref:Uncharacterized protein n=1 Tax=Penstemon smallii TaxID=265156 RepID=A0ABD3RJZ7_9LAMI
MEKNSLGLRKGTWTKEEDDLLKQCIDKYGEGKWHKVPLRAGLNRCRKSCRLRWLNYLRPDIKKGLFTRDEVDLIIRLHKLLGNKWSLIAGRLPGRTANDVKNFWNTHIHKKLSTADVGKKGQMNNVHKMETVNVIRPQPRTFSKLHVKEIMRKTKITTNNENPINNKEKVKYSNSNLASLSLKEDYNHEEDMTQWWSKMLETAENLGTRDNRKGQKLLELQDGDRINNGDDHLIFELDNVDFWENLNFDMKQ